MQTVVESYFMESMQALINKKLDSFINQENFAVYFSNFLLLFLIL